ncbi:MAG: hypothetical protein BZY75_05920 [SAR202 cluster bacterium Io17-Chloro-G7]|nr:MAG: hypothetical protein BZY75_05920 [SAR202 cluster bacterium Io17-Chloro-G7]
MVVLTAPDAGPSSPMPSGHASSSGSQLSERNLLLSVDSLRVSMGGTVEGVIKITPKEGLNSAAAPVDSIRIELMRSEKSGTRVFDLGVGLLEFREPEAIAGPITAGSPLEIQYSLTIPECLLATIAVHETAVTWRVRATVCLGNGEELEISQGVTVRGSD